ncbi:MAG: YicC family protein [Salibacteraceae bacterium]|jgi:uncharacterized protein (TIGR00255 family)|nr:YicC family protein [Salibacteraceae bacterium]MDP4685757.1 YicC family protein [Salibacteraceae bacterium]MDP4762472.1 YicC family protein [Salibacteraceae bacterium]MDP4843520.1 YicC family protein [Salibacteraceae bacterium]MDP4933249.1 YicC family protein [Salibacteraceae bacterium]
MTHSMTGYGKHSVSYKGRVLTIEIRSLNSKQTDLNVRMPAIYREKEFELRDLLSNKLHRGKIDLSIQRDLAPGEASTNLNDKLVKTYYDRIKKIEAELEEPGADTATEYIALITKLPDTLKPVSEDLDEDEYVALVSGLEKSLEMADGFRAQEGAKLEVVLRASTESIASLLKSIEPLEVERLAKIRAKLQAGIDEIKDLQKFDSDRYEQELIYYLEKLDITEEKVRLQAHCDYFLKTLAEEHLKGKKLSFIAQEMGREINTLGSKSQNSDMQRVVVEMKDELEKIKEQVLNVL